MRARDLLLDAGWREISPGVYRSPAQSADRGSALRLADSHEEEEEEETFEERSRGRWLD